MKYKTGYYVPDYKHRVRYNFMSETKRGLIDRPNAVKCRNAAMKWCDEQGIDFIWDAGEVLWRFRFRTEEDALLFKLAWGV